MISNIFSLHYFWYKAEKSTYIHISFGLSQLWLDFMFFALLTHPGILFGLYIPFRHKPSRTFCFGMKRTKKKENITYFHIKRKKKRKEKTRNNPGPPYGLEHRNNQPIRSHQQGPGREHHMIREIPEQKARAARKESPERGSPCPRDFPWIAAGKHEKDKPAS